MPLVKTKADRDDITPVPLTNPNYFAQLSFWPGYFHPAPANGGSKRYDCSVKKWMDSDIPGVSLPGFEERRKSTNQNGSIASYVNPVIPEGELMTYLRNPIGKKIFHINARSYSKDTNSESQTDYYITLSLE